MKKSDDTDPRQPDLFVLPEGPMPEPKVKRNRYPVWTENKARLIERYLYYFVLITKHGTYIDGFAGPQDSSKPETWAAKLVLETEPRWLRHFFLFDEGKSQCEYLRRLRDAQPQSKPKRNIHVYRGDFNSKIMDLLNAQAIPKKDATFCLLDQRTFECHWSTLEALARYKESGNKIELFYFLSNAWLDRALSGIKNFEILERWWGRSDWQELKGMSSIDRAQAWGNRIKSELGYWSVKPWPIYERQDSSNIMYYMIHATDHPDAPSLMSRAYAKAVQPKEGPEQFMLEFGLQPDS